MTIAAAVVPITISLGALPSGTVGTVYSQSIGVSGGTGPYSFAVSIGTLPAGLSSKPSTGPRPSWCSSSTLLAGS